MLNFVFHLSPTLMLPVQGTIYECEFSLAILGAAGRVAHPCLSGYVFTMCTVVILRRPDHDWPLVLAANRDEMLSRPWQPPARHWLDRGMVTAGLDELAGGTWLGVNDFGVVAGVLNRKGALGPQEGFRTRGELPLEALDHADARAAATALGHLDPSAYRPFNMIVADNQGAYWLAHAEGVGRVLVTELPVGVSMITSGERNDLRIPRIRNYLPRFEQATAPDPDLGDWTTWQDLLASREHEPVESQGEAMNIVGDGGFGTASSSLIALPAAERPGPRYLWLFAAGRPDEQPFEPVEGANATA